MVVTAGTGRARPRFAEEWLVAVLDSLSEGVIAIDGAGRLTAANPAAEALLGFVVADRRYEHWSALGLAGLEDGDGATIEPHPIDRALDEDAPSTVTAVAPAALGRPWVELSTHILDPVAGAGSGVVVSFRDVTRRVTARRDRERALAVLRDVLAMTSHDLRGPITTIAGYAQFLVDHVDADDADGHAGLTAIRRQADHLGRLVVDLSLAARIESAALEAEPDDVDLAEAVAEAVQTARIGDVGVDVEPGLEVRADPGHLLRILGNLLENAGKYGAPPVRVTGGRSDGRVEVRVTDAGPGVPATFVPVLFDRFTRAASGDVTGSGLGLAIVAGLTAANDGSVRYESPADGGACFVLEFPAGDGSDPDRRPAASVPRDASGRSAT